MIDCISKKFHDKKVAGLSLNVRREPRIELLVHDEVSNEFLVIKDFKNEKDYERFLVEAVILRESCHNKDISHVRKMYRKICDFLRSRKDNKPL
nr:unnamed protein product [uncultured bacterium]